MKRLCEKILLSSLYIPKLLENDNLLNCVGVDNFVDKLCLLC